VLAPKQVDELAAVLAQLTKDVPTTSRQKYDWGGLYTTLVKRGGGFNVGMIRDLCNFDIPKQQRYNRIYSWIRNHAVDLKTARKMIAEGIPADEVAFVQLSGVAVPIHTLAAAMKPSK